jgi:hypothetical protein
VLGLETFVPAYEIQLEAIGENFATQYFRFFVFFQKAD